MARDRKRAKQRRARRGTGRTQAEPARRPAGGSAEPADAQESAVGHGQIERADLPGALEHAGDVDEFDAALVKGAGGTPANPDTIEELEAEADASVPKPPKEAPADETEEARVEAEIERQQESHRGIGGRAAGFLRASWAELQRVQWPDRRQVFQATAVVLGFVAIAGVYLGVADYLAKEIVEFIL